jgi:hypothetical protein
LADFILAVARQTMHQTEINFLSNFPAIRYDTHAHSIESDMPVTLHIMLWEIIKTIDGRQKIGIILLLSGAKVVYKPYRTLLIDSLNSHKYSYTQTD